MPRLAQLLSGVLLAAGASAAAAQGHTSTVQVDGRRNPGDVPYKYFWEGQQQLRGFMPPEPRVLQLSYRILFVELSERQSDEYLPKSWGVSIVGDHLDQDLDVRRGGYFTLDYSQQAIDEDAIIMFKEHTMSRAIGLAWLVRLGPGQALPYADLQRALGEVRAIQQQVTPGNLALRTLKRTSYNGLKACFLAPDGDIRIDGVSSPTGRIGNCLVLKYDQARRDSGATIEFVGPLDIVTLVDTRL